MDKQKEILNYLNTVENADLEMIYKNVSFSYYCNYKKHLGSILSTMVKNNKVERIKKGLFKIKSGLNNYKKNNLIEDINQTKLF